jgi:broad specificity phosphatase PhoE
MARHGEGWHNVAQAYYGDVKWDAYWCEKDGNGTVTWFDAHLTDNGVAQAQNLSQAWQHQLDVAKTPAPQSYYVSPLDRTCATGNLTFSTLNLPQGATPYVPTIKEKLRETLGVATCDERSNKTYIAGQFPTYKFEAGFTEDDELWKPYWLEPPWSQDTRMGELLDDVFTNDTNTFISFTSHSGSIASLLRVVGHQTFALDTAGLLPVLVQSTVDGS